MNDRADDVDGEVMSRSASIDHPASDDHKDRGDDNGPFGAEFVQNPDSEWRWSQEDEVARDAQVVELRIGDAVPVFSRLSNDTRSCVSPTNGEGEESQFCETKPAAFVETELRGSIRFFFDQMLVLDIIRRLVVAILSVAVIVCRLERFSLRAWGS